MIQNVVCLDPGQTTGVAFFTLDDNQLTLVEWSECNLWDSLPSEISRCKIVVYENIIARHPSFNPIGLEVIGVIKYLAAVYQSELVCQSPVVISGIQKWPIFQWKHVKSPHQRDAISHGIAFARSRKFELKLPDEFQTVST